MSICNYKRVTHGAWATIRTQPTPVWGVPHPLIHIVNGRVRFKQFIKCCHMQLVIRTTVNNKRLFRKTKKKENKNSFQSFRVCWSISCWSSAYLWFVSAFAFVVVSFVLLFFTFSFTKKKKWNHLKERKKAAASFVRHANATQTITKKKKPFWAHCAGNCGIAHQKKSSSEQQQHWKIQQKNRKHAGVEGRDWRVNEYATNQLHYQQNQSNLEHNKENQT